MSSKTSVTKRQLIKGAATLGAATALPVAADAADAPLPSLSEITPGPFKPDWASLAAGYQVPEWFRDAKFGIWAHWSAQCVPEQGDWYARQMYIQGHPQYDHHLKTYGHPADTGFMEIDNLWKAENWNPDELVAFYKKSGAKYFFALANHHDNFDNYDSKFHDWNSTKVGPKKDLIAGWARAARKQGMKFGVSNHSAHAWHWFQTAYDYDPEGPRAGQRYDAYKLTKADGKGKWWEGLDPQELYVGPTYVMPDGVTTIKDANDFHTAKDRKWDENPPAAHPEFTRQWFLRCKDLMDSYKPDMVYFDNSGLPLGQAGLDVVAHYYNAGLKWHGGKQEVVIFSKGLSPDKQGAVVLDIERGSAADIQPHPWQTDTCLGAWHYDRSIYLNKKYKSAETVVHMLCNIVAKNGNLLLSVPVRGDGTIDDEERRIVESIGGWLGRFGDAIFGTRPWRIAGEGPTESASGANFGESKQKPFTAEDIRFTTKKGALYAITLGKITGDSVTIKSLGTGAPNATGTIKRVQVADAKTPLVFTRDENGLHITVPAALKHDYGVAFKITGSGLT
jgi:alpha-L-fucosidase